MKSIGSRIIVSFGILILIVCLAFGIISYYTSANSLMNVLNDTMPKFAIEASLTIEDSLQNHLNVLGLIASSEEMRVLKEPGGNYSAVVPFLSREARRAGHEKMILIDRSGKGISDQGEVLDLKDHSLFSSAMSGESTVSEPLFDTDGSKIVMAYAVPVVIDNQTAGVLMAVRDGLELSEFVKRIKLGETTEAFIINNQGRTIAHADTGLLIEIIDTRTVDAAATASLLITETDGGGVDTVASATLDEAERNTFGFDNFTEVQKKMMQGETGFAEYKYKGVSKVAGFAPIPGYGWSIAVSVDKAEMMAELDNLRPAFVLISFIFLAVGIIVSYLMGRNISRPVTDLAKQCIIMSEGDFTTKEVSKKYVERRDEIGELTRGFRKIRENVSEIIKNVISESQSVDNAIITASESMAKLNNEIQVMSDITQELSAKIEETSAMAEEMNATAAEIERAIDTIAVKAQEGAESAGEVSKRADELRNNAMESQMSAREIQENNSARLREAIEKARAVERINILSDAILEIASRTNLLSLNATIEAAQAGEAGRGFAVVAEEIRSLAENSRKTASEIQKVTQQVLESVQNLSECSEQVLDFLENKVAKDYDMLVETGKKYNIDARMIDDMVTDFSATSQELYSSVQSIMKAINDVAEAATEGASDTMNMAGETSIVAAKAGEVMEQARIVRDSAERLIKAVSLFRV
ncbi:MAG: methyl-accepting chemotaxis protein [Clostridiaceae bacterium]|nr:methyl-accepting chemotaxis protein [Clostridiaceae bacterium]